MLGAMRLVIDRPVPVLGVNHGNLGFLVEVTPHGLEKALARLIDRRLHRRAARLPGRRRGRAGDPVRLQRRGAGPARPQGRRLGRSDGQRPAVRLLPLRRRGARPPRTARPPTTTRPAARSSRPRRPARSSRRWRRWPGSAARSCWATTGDADRRGGQRPVAVDVDGTAAGELAVATRAPPCGGRRPGGAAVGRRPRQPQPGQAEPARPAAAPGPAARADPGGAAQKAEISVRRALSDDQPGDRRDGRTAPAVRAACTSGRRSPP